MDEKKLFDGWQDAGAKIVSRERDWGSGGDVVGQEELVLSRILGVMGLRELPRGLGPKVKAFKRYFNDEVAGRIGTKLRLPEGEEMDEITALLIEKFLSGRGEELKRPFDVI